jgi:hypothetical protein
LSRRLADVVVAALFAHPLHPELQLYGFSALAVASPDALETACALQVVAAAASTLVAFAHHPEVQQAACSTLAALAGQVALSQEELQAAGITAAHSLADYAGSVRRAIEDAAGQLAGLAERTAAGLSRE